MDALVQEIERFILDNDLNDARLRNRTGMEYLRFFRDSGGMSEDNQRESSCTEIAILGFGHTSTIIHRILVSSIKIDYQGD